MIPQCHGIIGHEPVNGGNDRPLVDAVEQRSLKLIPGIQRNDIILLRPGLPDGGGNTPQTAPACLRRKTGIASGITPGQEGMRVIDMQQAQFQFAGLRHAGHENAAQARDGQRGARQLPPTDTQRRFHTLFFHATSLSKSSDE